MAVESVLLLIKQLRNQILSHMVVEESDKIYLLAKVYFFVNIFIISCIKKWSICRKILRLKQRNLHYLMMISEALTVCKIKISLPLFLLVWVQSNAIELCRKTFKKFYSTNLVHSTTQKKIESNCSHHNLLISFNLYYWF